MPVRVRVKNFQSIEDAEVIIDGFVVICGPNNSGKTALMRAIRGLFTNAAPGSYLRQGANFLSVEIEFDDGTTVLWEKGWEKPGKKGAAINRYTINGYQISSVGRGVPPEVEALGVKSILAGNNPIWPQVADQFDGTLFLVNKTGAVVAEALSDVDRVGRLTDALRLSEKDKRTANAEIKVRRDDLKSFQDEVDRYRGLNQVRDQVQGLAAQKTGVVDLKSSLDEAQGLQARLVSLTEAWRDLKDFSCEVPQEPSGIREYKTKIANLKSLKSRWDNLYAASQDLVGFDPPQWTPDKVSEIKSALAECRAYSAKLTKLEKESEGLEGLALPQFTDSTKAEKIPKVLSIVRDFKSRKAALVKTLQDLESEVESVNQKARQNEALVTQLLGERGYCPTCKTVHSGGH